MKRIYTADWHIRYKNPRVRKDDYPTIQYKKIEWIRDLANKLKAQVFVAGDVFDKPYCPTEWMYKYLSLFKSFNNGLFSVYGQHDIHFHNSSLNRTPYGVMLIGGGLIDVSELIGVYACNFGEGIGETETETLVIHTPITKDAPPFYMEDAISAKNFIVKHNNFKTIVSGDFHEQHVTTYKGTTLFNPGPIMRTSKDKMNFKPAVIVHDTESNKWEWEYIPIESDVFDFDILDKDDMKDYKNRLREFAGNIDSTSIEQNFRENVKIVVGKLKPNNGVLKILSEVVDGY